MGIKLQIIVREKRELCGAMSVSVGGKGRAVVTPVPVGHAEFGVRAKPRGTTS